MIHHGDSVEVMAAMDAESIDAIVTDPPYSLAFMGKAWDKNLNHGPWAEAALRVAKPGAYLLAFGGTRTVHRLTVALEDAGWIVRDVLVWAYAQGFPKSKSSLKPAWEPIVLARKPGPLAPLNIDECRLSTTPVGHEGSADKPPAGDGQMGDAGSSPAMLAGERFGGGAKGTSGFANGYQRGDGFVASTQGRWPANVILTDPIFDGGWEGVEGGGETTSGKMRPTAVRNERGTFGADAADGYTTMETCGDTGTYSRFFLIPKASRRDREPTVLPDDWPQGQRFSTHPTVKPTRLMRHLIRLVTPEGGTVLDPFLGSGTTAKAAVLEGVKWVGIEREPEYIRIAEQRLVGLEPEPEQLEMTG